MTKDQFILWLREFIDLSDAESGLDASMVGVIRAHLSRVSGSTSPGPGRDRADKSDECDWITVAAMSFDKSCGMVDMDPRGAGTIPNPWEWVGHR